MYKKKAGLEGKEKRATQHFTFAEEGRIYE